MATTHRVDRAAQILAELRRKGSRITTARRFVVDALVDTDGHVTAEELAATVQQTSPDIHLSTVYRTLDSLEEFGVIDRVFLGQGSAVYHLADNQHHHLVCETCGTIVHLPAGTFDSLARDIKERYGFTLLAHHVGLTGYCEKCNKSEPVPDT